jgi:nucleoid-associated protein YgaU
VIRPGDTLSRIAARELGSISLANNIYLLNRDVIADPDRLMAGDRIRLPSREPIDGARDQAPPSPGGGQPERQTHRVAAGDTLSSIALRYYDSSASWRGIFAANRDILSNPNRLEVGMELVIPPEAE